MIEGTIAGLAAGVVARAGSISGGTPYQEFDYLQKRDSHGYGSYRCSSIKGYFYWVARHLG